MLHNSTPAIVAFFDYHDHGLIVSVLIGLVIGAVAKLLMPGKDPGGCIITSLLGLAGSAIGTFLGRMLFHENYAAGFIMSVVGAMLLLFIYRLVVRRKGP